MHRLPVVNQALASAEGVQVRPGILDKCPCFTRADELKAAGLYPYQRVIESGQDTRVRVDGREMLMLGSNSYLELTTHPRVKARAMQAIRDYGSGCAGSRFLNGTLPIHVELEARLAALVGKEAALVFPTGFQTNTGVLATLVGPGEHVVADKYAHACILDGCHLSGCHLVRYNHNDMNDLERRLDALPVHEAALVVTEGVFSMEGDLADLPEVVRLAKAYRAQVMVDDAHGLGVLGPGGAGTAAHFGLSREVDLIVGTFSKSLAAIGGFVAGPERTINYLMHNARPYLFSASASPASVAAVLGALEVMADEPERLERLWRNVRFLKGGLDAMGLDTGASASPVIPVVVGEFNRCLMIWRFLHEEGIFVNPVVPPAVPPGRSLLRLSVTAGHSLEQLAQVLAVFRKVIATFHLTQVEA